VFLGTHVGTGQTFAIKKVPLPSGQHFRRQKESLEREIMVLRDCRSPYIVSYFGSFVDPEGANMCIVMEFLAGGTLQDVVKEYDQHGGLDEPLMHGVLTSVLKGLAYLHDRNIMHRDLLSCFICLCFFKKKKNRNQRIFSLTQMDPQNLPILVFLVS
jgi:serine/threonine protein kinase